jgi:hypothetical protein
MNMHAPHLNRAALTAMATSLGITIARPHYDARGGVKTMAELWQEIQELEKEAAAVEAKVDHEALQILCVCSNADSPRNLEVAKQAINALQYHGLLQDSVKYTYLAVNPDKMTQPMVFDGVFQTQFPSNVIRGKFDVVCFFGCMTCAPYTGDASVYFHKHTVSHIYNLLKPNGLFLNYQRCYYDGRGQTMTPVLETMFQYIDKLEIQQPTNQVYVYVDVWRARHASSSAS